MYFIIYIFICIFSITQSTLVCKQMTAANDDDVTCDAKNPRYVGTSCTSSTDCQFPSICVEGKCSCDEGYLQVVNSCVPAPLFGSRCIQNQCRRPVLCDSDFCTKCPAEFNSTGFGCVPVCGDDQIPGEEGCLMKVRNLGGICNETMQCQTAYAQCINHQCTCTLGTTQTPDGCISVKSRCPNGASAKLNINGVVEKCRSLVCNGGPSESEHVISTCPDGFVCLPTSWQLEEGMCCPKETPWCPVGEPLLEKSCHILAFSRGIQQQSNVVLDPCPLRTHFCHSSSSGSELSYCCPLPCPHLVDHIAVIVEGQCYREAILNERCQVDGQCPLNAICDPDTFICACGPEFLAQQKPNINNKRNNQLMCAQRCKAHQISISAGCFEPSMPMNACDHSAQCIYGGTKCRDGICQCACDMTLHNGKCIKTPTCPMGDGSDSVPGLSDEYGYIECVAGSATFALFYDICRKHNAYCAPNSDISYGGVCCLFPEAKCPSGSRAETSSDGSQILCNLSSPSQCSTGAFCHDFISSAIKLPQSAVVQGLCCSNQVQLADDTDRPLLLP